MHHALRLIKMITRRDNILQNPHASLTHFRRKVNTFQGGSRRRHCTDSLSLSSVYILNNPFQRSQPAARRAVILATSSPRFQLLHPRCGSRLVADCSALVRGCWNPFTDVEDGLRSCEASDLVHRG